MVVYGYCNSKSRAIFLSFDNWPSKQCPSQDWRCERFCYSYCQSFHSDLYCQKFPRLKGSIQNRPASTKRREIVLHHANARPHTSIGNRQRLQKFCWEVLIQPPYCPDLASSDYYLFLSMTNDFAGNKFVSRETCEKLINLSQMEIVAQKSCIMKYILNAKKLSKKSRFATQILLTFCRRVNAS